MTGMNEEKELRLKAIRKDMEQYLDAYYRDTGLKYMLDDYGRRGLIKGYQRLPGSNQQVVRMESGELVFDSGRDVLTKEKLMEIFRKCLDMSRFKPLDTVYVLSYLRYYPANGREEWKELEYTDKTAAEKNYRYLKSWPYASDVQLKKVDKREELRKYVKDVHL